jgi:methionine synthase / methylenetetrahydrofolate reductase(NADPH)
MLKPFLEHLNNTVVICDGAMGTQLYSKGVFLNRCFDELNLSRPPLVREVHQEYLWAGAEILETNTFGANRIKLEPHGLADRVRDINISGVQIAKDVAQGAAYVGGSIGPLGIRVEPYGKLSVEEARKIFAEQIAALAEGGVDLLSLETFSDLREIEAAILAAKELCDLPIMAQLTLEEDGNSLDGTPPETFGLFLEELGVDIVGINCGVGPQVMLESIERMARVVSRKIVAQPNAGKPRNFEGRNLYLSSPEYMASYARRFVRAGVRIVGGCCGTTPAHIRAIRAAVLAAKSGASRSVAVPAAEPTTRVEVTPVQERSHLGRLIFAKKNITVVEMLPPRGVDSTSALEAACQLKDAGVDALLISEAPRASARMGAMALAVLLERDAGVEPILHYTCSNRGLLAMQSELLGAYAIGVRNLLLSDGEPIRVGDYMDATAVFEADSAGVTRLVRGLNHGRDLGGKPIGKPAGFYVGVTVNPSFLSLDEEIRRLEQKVEAGAEFVITEPIFVPDLLEAFIRRTRHCPVPFVAGIRLLTSARDTEFLANEVPGVSVPDDLLHRMRAAGTPEREREEGIAIARELVRSMRGIAQGIDLSIWNVPYGGALEVLADS